MPGEMRQGQHEPIVALRNGQPPGWIVYCLEIGCGFAHDAHGETEALALQEVQPIHESAHKLVARPVEYADHPLYRTNT